MDKKLEILFGNFQQALAEAQKARLAVLDYLEYEYDIDTIAEIDKLEDRDDWCFGLSHCEITKMITIEKEN